MRKNNIVISGQCANLTPADKKIYSLKENYPKEFFYSCMNLLSTHDTIRIITLLNDRSNNLTSHEDKINYLNEPKDIKVSLKRLKLAVILQMTMPGMPSIYYGDEVGLEGFEDPLNRRTYPWDNGNDEILSFYKEWTTIRNKFISFKLGEYETVYCNDTVYGYSRYIRNGVDAFGENRDNEEFLVFINSSKFNTASVDFEEVRYSKYKFEDYFTHEKIESFFKIKPLEFKLLKRI